MASTTNITSSAQQHSAKKLLFVGLAAAVLALSACNKKDDSTIEGSALELDSETSEAEAAAEIAAADPMNSVDTESAILPSDDMAKGTGKIAGDGGGAGEVASAGLDMKEGMYTDDNTTGSNAENSNAGVANDGVDDTEALNDGNKQDAAPAN